MKKNLERENFRERGKFWGEEIWSNPYLLHQIGLRRPPLPLAHRATPVGPQQGLANVLKPR